MERRKADFYLYKQNMFIQQTLPIMLCLVKFHPSSVHLSLNDDKGMRRKETG